MTDLKPSDYQAALNDLIRIPHGKFAKRHLKTVHSALTHCASTSPAVNAAELDEMINAEKFYCIIIGIYEAEEDDKAIDAIRDRDELLFQCGAIAMKQSCIQYAEKYQDKDHTFDIAHGLKDIDVSDLISKSYRDSLKGTP